LDHAGVWIVIAAYNEASRLGHVLDGLLPAWPNIVVVDDGSSDATNEVASRQPVWVLRHLTNLGQGAALQTGIDFALLQGAAQIVTFDADGQHDPGDIDRLLAPIVRGEADFVLGSRFLGRAPGIPRSRRMLLRAAVLFTRIFSHVRVTDAHNGLRALSRRGAQAIRITMNRMEHASEILDQIRASGLAYAERPVTVRYTGATMAKGQRSWAAFRLALRLIVERIVK